MSMEEKVRRLQSRVNRLERQIDNLERDLRDIRTQEHHQLDQIEQRIRALELHQN